MTESSGGNRSSHAEALLALALSADAPGEDCPPNEQIVAWHEGRLDREAGQLVEHHVAHCDGCYALWTGLMEAEALESPAATISKVPSGSWVGWLHGLLTTRAVAAAAVAVIAAGVILSVVISQPPLPPYGLAVDGRTKLVRGKGAGSDSVAVFDQGNLFRLLLTPATAADDEIEVRVYVAAHEDLQQVPVPAAQVTVKGVVLVEGIVGADVALPEGEADLFVVVGRGADLPSSRTLQERLRDTSQFQDRHWSAWKIPMRVEK